MSNSNKPVSSLRQRMIEDMTLRKLGPGTQAGYIRAVVKLARYLGQSPDTATAEDLRLFQLHLVEQGSSSIFLNVIINAFREESRLLTIIAFNESAHSSPLNRKVVFYLTTTSFHTAPGQSSHRPVAINFDLGTTQLWQYLSVGVRYDYFS